MLFGFIFNLIKKNFSLDLRSLALFRILVASLLIFDFLFTRLPYFTLFYTKEGMIQQEKGIHSSLNFVSASNGYQFALFILFIVCCFILLVGYKTKWALLGTWILYASFDAKNFLIINGGDRIMCLMLFWALSLPLSRYFSIDSAFSKEKQKNTSVFSVSSFAYISQILMIYYFSYFFKTGFAWKSGQAIYYSLMMDQFRTGWGSMLLKYPDLMSVLTYMTLYLEISILFLFLLFGFWWPLRMVIIFIMCGFHISTGLFLHIGLFSWICVISWIVFLPGEFWKKIKKITTVKKHPLTVYYDGQCSFCKKSIALIKTFLLLPSHVSFLEAQSNKQALLEMEKQNSWLVTHNHTEYKNQWNAGIILLSYSPLFFYLTPLLKLKIFSIPGNWLYKKVASNRQKLGHLLPEFSLREHKPLKVFSLMSSVFFLLCFMHVVLENVRYTDFEYPKNIYSLKKWNEIRDFLHLYQGWWMFAPGDSYYNSWIILSAIKSNEHKKEAIDLWRQGKPVNINRPHRYDLTFPGFRFREFIPKITYGHPEYSVDYLIYLCNKWNKKLNKNNERIQNIEFSIYEQKVPPFGEQFPNPTKRIIKYQECPQRT